MVGLTCIFPCVRVRTISISVSVRTNSSIKVRTLPTSVSVWDISTPVTGWKKQYPPPYHWGPYSPLHQGENNIHLCIIEDISPSVSGWEQYPLLYQCGTYPTLYQGENNIHLCISVSVQPCIHSNVRMRTLSNRMREEKSICLCGWEFDLLMCMVWYIIYPSTSC